MILVKEQIDQWNRIKSPEMNLHENSQLIFDKRTKAKNGAKIVLSTNRARKTEYPLKKKKRNLDTDFTSFIKISTK